MAGRRSSSPSPALDLMMRDKSGDKVMVRTMTDLWASDSRPHVVIVGGFGGLTAAQSFKRAPVRVTLADRSNHHLFQPLLYRVIHAEFCTPVKYL